MIRLRLYFQYLTRSMALHIADRPCKIASTIARLPGSLPTIPLPQSLSKVDIVSAASALAPLLQSSTLAAGIFTDDAFWRDQFTLTQNLRTFYGPSAATAAWSDVASSANVRNVKVLADTVNLQPTWSTVLITFHADLRDIAAECQGLL
jgi:hypothetical protein